MNKAQEIAAEMAGTFRPSTLTEIADMSRHLASLLENLWGSDGFLEARPFHHLADACEKMVKLGKVEA